jgi:hypothetical protein
MNKLIYFSNLKKSFSTVSNFKKSFSTEKIFIRNKNLPSCINCINFIGHTNNYPYDELPSDKLYGKCKKFGDNHLVTGLTEYDYAKNCRDDINKCGKNGSEYIAIYQENNKIVK